MFKKLFGFNKNKNKNEENNVEIEKDAPIVDEPQVEDNTVDNKAVEEVNKEVCLEAEELIESPEVATEDMIETVVEPEEIAEETKLEEVEEVEEVKIEQPVEKPKKKPNFFSKLKSGLTKTRQGMTDKINTLLNAYTKIDEEFLEELEEILIVSDIGMDTTMKVIEALRKEVRENGITEITEVKTLLKSILVRFLDAGDTKLNIEPSPAILVVVGVNGVGKTTSIGKIAANLRNDGKRILIAAGDTFRAAAIDQLKVWGDRSNTQVIHQQEGSDPAAVIFDAISAAKARKTDVLICDTAGRLHNKKNLMNELAKIFKIIDREYEDAQKEVLLVLDATTGQNAIQQAKTFKEICNVTGVVLTKLDGTAKGGVVLSITSELGIPVKFIGVGEGIEDLQPFNAQDFVEALIP